MLLFLLVGSNNIINAASKKSLATAAAAWVLRHRSTSNAVVASSPRRRFLHPSSSLVVASSSPSPFPRCFMSSSSSSSSTKNNNNNNNNNNNSSNNSSDNTNNDKIANVLSTLLPTTTTTSSSSSSLLLVGNNVEHAAATLVHADCVCLDVDSTVIVEEGIDVLAEFLGMGKEVSDLTRQAMEGGMKFQDAFRARLDLLRPSTQDIQDCLAAHPLVLTPGVESFVRTLQEYDKDVYLVSGGLRLMIQSVAEALHIDDRHNVYANTLHFDGEGRYLDFDATEPTSADMGKARALQQIQDRHNYRRMVMIGDGATDAQAKPPAETFIGFGGVVERTAVRERACWFVTDFAHLERVVRECS